MATIVECFSDKSITQITLHGAKIVDRVDENGMVYKEKEVGIVFNIDVSSPLYKSKIDIQNKISEEKLKYVNKDGYLFLVTNGRDKLGIRFLHKVTQNNIIQLIKVGENSIYGEDEIKFDEYIFEKIDIVYKKVLETTSDLDTLLHTIHAMKRTYKNTGIITKDDLTWLNDIYKKFS